MRTLGIVLTLASAVLAATTAYAQRDAGSKIRGEYNFYGGAASRSMRGAREYAQSYREYVRTAPQQKVESHNQGLPWLADLPYLGVPFRRVREEVNEVHDERITRRVERCLVVQRCLA